MQVLVIVTSTRHFENFGVFLTGINRNLEDFPIDTTGRQALELLESNALTKLRETQANDVAVFVKGCAGILTGSRLHPKATKGGANLFPDETRKSLLDTSS